MAKAAQTAWGEQMTSTVARLSRGSLEGSRAAISNEVSGPGSDSERGGLAVYGELVTQSAPMLRLFELLHRLESSLLSVLIEGESGTGKELVARAIHGHSELRTGPFVAINCGAVQRELVASELFGHRRGAFTGAVESRQGAFEAASGGTLFLDEIAELPLELQPMLLRALEQRVVTRLGETEPRPVNLRVLSASHVSLAEQVQAGRFRRDLYYRLAAVRMCVPPLRDRADDIALLARLFARRAGGAEPPASLVGALRAHHWPGNVRELRHAVEAYQVLGTLSLSDTSGQFHGDCLARFVDLHRPYRELKEELLASFSKLYLSQLLEHTSGNVSRAARLSGLERSYLNKLVRRQLTDVSE